MSSPSTLGWQPRTGRARVLLIAIVLMLGAACDDGPRAPVAPTAAARAPAAAESGQAISRVVANQWIDICHSTDTHTEPAFQHQTAAFTFSFTTTAAVAAVATTPT